MEHFKESFNFVLCGDSISKGVIYDEDRKKYVILKDSFGDILQSRIKGAIHNSAKFGNTLVKVTGKFLNNILKTNPDFALIEFGGNDCDFNWQDVAKDPLGAHQPHTELNAFSQLLKNLIQYFEDNSIVPVLLTIPPIDADKYFNWISENNSILRSKLLLWLGSVSKIYWWQERYNSAIVRVAQETETKWVDIREAFLRTPDFRQFLCLDGIHPNKEGHKLIADKIIDCIKCKSSYLLKENFLVDSK